MELRRVGSTGLHVSAVGLGTMTWGQDTDELDAQAQVQAFLDAGGTLIDTAAAYGEGDAESIVGSLLTQQFRRQDLHLCTKAGVRHSLDGPIIDASRHSILNSLDASLQRLNTDYVDLFLVHCPDQNTRLTETLSALEYAVRSGRARYVGLSNYPAWQTAQAAVALAQHSLELAAVEVEYSLLQRGVERELVPAVTEFGTGVLAWSPLGRGVLTGKYRRSIPGDSRGASAHLAGFVSPYLGSEATAIVEAVTTAAEGLSQTPLAVALAWVLAQPAVSSAIVGARTPQQLRQTLAKTTLELPDAVLRALDDVSAVPMGYPERR